MICCGHGKNSEQFILPPPSFELHNTGLQKSTSDFNRGLGKRKGFGM